MEKSMKIFVTLLSITIGIIIIATLLLLNPRSHTDNDDHIFKRATNRTYKGFEKDDNLEWKDNFYFIQASDPQYGLFEQLDRESNNDTEPFVATNWTRDRKLLQKAIEQWNQMIPRPKFVIICGNLANDQPSKNQTKRREQLNDLKQDLRELDSDIPLILLPGDHDLNDEPSIESLKQYNDEFGDDYFTFYLNHCMFIVLNTQLLKNHTEMAKQYAEQIEWLDDQLTEASNDNYTHVIIFQHVPWFLKTIDEPDDYSNYTIDSKIRQQWIDKFLDINVHHVFAGHLHQNMIGHYNKTDTGEWLEMITTSAIGAQLHPIASEEQSKSGYRVVNVTIDKVEHKYVNIED